MLQKFFCYKAGHKPGELKLEGREESEKSSPACLARLTSIFQENNALGFGW